MQQFDPTVFAVGGVSLIVLIFGLVEFLKSLFNLDGKAVTALSACLGAVIFGVYQSLQFLPPVATEIFTVLIGSLTFGMSASGYYKFASSRAPKRNI